MNQDEFMQRLRQTRGAPVPGRFDLEALNLAGQTLEVPLNLNNARVIGPVNLSGARLNDGLLAIRTTFEAPFDAKGCVIRGNAWMSHARFWQSVDLSWVKFKGRAYLWRARFHGATNFLQMICEAGASDDEYVYPGEFNLSWARFEQPVSFERAAFKGPAQFWRTRFLNDVTFDGASFEDTATFMGTASEISVSRAEIGADVFARLQAADLLRPDPEEEDGRAFAQLKGVESLQQLNERMESADLPAADRQRLAELYREQSGAMFQTHASLGGLRIGKGGRINMTAVNARGVAWGETDVTAIGFYNSHGERVPINVGLGCIYDRVFISYGGPDQMVAERFNQELLAAGVDTFFYPEDARVGEIINQETSMQIDDCDRVLLILSETSWSRPGWLFELEQALRREATLGFGKVLIVVAISGDLSKPWDGPLEPLRAQLFQRTLADFRNKLDDRDRFNRELERLLAALRQPDPSPQSSQQQPSAAGSHS